jgi:GDPmannose 4,6-dehydratase
MLLDLPFVHPTSAADIRDQAALDKVLSTVTPSVVFHLAAQSSVSASWEDPAETAEVTGVGTARLLDAVQRLVPTARVFVASSSEIFGHPSEVPQTETTRIQPVSPYGAAKAYAHYVASSYRVHYGLFIAIGILFNHESPRRPPGFVTQKIIRGAVAVAQGKQDRLVLGNLESRRDWGYAGDYVRAMALMTLDSSNPADFVVATGETHSVRDWCEIAFRRVGLHWADYVVSDASLYRPDDPAEVVGDPSRLVKLLGWKRSVSFAELVNLMMDAEMERRR